MSTKKKDGLRLVLPAAAIVTITGLAAVAACGDDTGDSGSSTGSGNGGATASASNAAAPASNSASDSASDSSSDNVVTQGQASAGGEGGDTSSA